MHSGPTGQCQQMTAKAKRCKPKRIGQDRGGRGRRAKTFAQACSWCAPPAGGSVAGCGAEPP
ncbi:hypothetical protein [Azospirillum largimobile]